jgi:hypothetical protein
MKVILADTLTTSLQRLPAAAQAAAKQSVFDFQVSPKSPGIQFHRIDKSRDKNFWSARVDRDLRLVIHKLGEVAVLCYVGHHEDAYTWAENRKLEAHPDTGAAQFVVIDERVEQVVKRVVREVEEEPPVFGKFERDYLLALGVPDELLDAVKVVTRARLDELIPLLPEEATERLFQLADGHPVPRPVKVTAADPFAHPDAQRRFKVVDSADELRQALEAGWDKWVVFLHPSQRTVIERDAAGPVKVSGSAGTGKTVVALHRAAHLLKQDPKARVLLTTYSTTLAARLEQQMDLLVPRDSSERKRLTVMHLHKVARDLWVEANRRPLKVVDERSLVRHIEQALRIPDAGTLNPAFVRAEWTTIIDPNHLQTFDAYRGASRAGRGTPLGARQKRILWNVVERLRSSLGAAGLLTWDTLCHEAAQVLTKSPKKRFDHVVADEVQDFGAADLVFLRSLVSEGRNDLFLCGDVGQRIYKMRTSWSALGVNVKGRSTRLKVNYRTTGQIRRFADRLLASSLADDDGEVETRETVSLLSGPEPDVVSFPTVEKEIDGVVAWLKPLVGQGYKPRDIAIFGRTEAVVERAERALDRAGIARVNLKDDEPLVDGAIAVGTMHRAKGLEFKIVVAMGCETGQVPLAAALNGHVDDADRDAALEQEKSLLYVALTRARERSLVTCAGGLTSLLSSVERGLPPK